MSKKKVCDILSKIGSGEGFPLDGKPDEEEFEGFRAHKLVQVVRKGAWKAHDLIAYNGRPNSDEEDYAPPSKLS